MTATEPDEAAPGQAAPGQATLDEAALVDAALKKTDLVWVGPDAGSARPVWHLWTDGALHLICGGGEQPAPVQPGGPAVVVVRSKDKEVRLVTFAASVEAVTAGDEWERLAAQLLPKRLNLPDGDAALQRWARESVLLRLRPQYPLLEGPGHYDTGSHAAVPPPTPAGTKVPRPWHLFGRPHRNR